MQLVKSLELLLLAGGATIASAYDVGCLWPEKAPDDLFVVRDRIVIVNEEHIPDLNSDAGAFGAGSETPIVIHTSHELTMCHAACTAYHSSSRVKDPITLEDPFFTVPPFGRNGYSIMMCLAQCRSYMDNTNNDYMINEMGFDVFPRSTRRDIDRAVDRCPDPTAVGCHGDCTQLCDIISESFDPYVIGAYLGIRINDYTDVDGWNRKGDMVYDYETGMAVPCTSNCRKYQNTIGYVPKPDPRSYPFLSEDDSKYDCTGDCRRWQPLQEEDPLGSLKRQEFIVPHIGYTARTYLRNATLSLEDPEYDLYNDSLQVIEELRMTSMDQYKKDQIQLMDNKVKVRWVLQNAVKKAFAETGRMSIQEYMMFLIGISTAEHDAVIQAWKEKVHHDYVRPTTVIKHWGGDELYTFGGDREETMPMNITARDFEAFVRVMPHGEFPSGSSCLCKAYQEFTDEFLMATKGETIENFGNNYNNKTYEDMSELLQICGDSRVWAGLHYPPAVPAGEQICTGLGTLATEWTLNLCGTADFGDEWYFGTPAPVCDMTRHRRNLRQSEKKDIFRRS